MKTDISQTGMQIANGIKAECKKISNLMSGIKFDVSSSVFSNSSSSPEEAMITVGAKGDFKITLWKVVLVFGALALFFAMLVNFFKMSYIHSAAKCIKRKIKRK
ncbi:MAG: hypothetical protein J5922_04575 [Clostridia bacterium]|nr:hypothetical protein [Clostridia bacterium]